MTSTYFKVCLVELLFNMYLLMWTGNNWSFCHSLVPLFLRITVTKIFLLSLLISSTFLERTSFITALPSAPVSVSPGKNVTFHCQFHVHEKDKAFYEGVTVGVLQSWLISWDCSLSILHNTLLVHIGKTHCEKFSIVISRTFYSPELYWETHAFVHKDLYEHKYQFLAVQI